MGGIHGRELLRGGVLRLDWAGRAWHWRDMKRGEGFILGCDGHYHIQHWAAVNCSWSLRDPIELFGYRGGRRMGVSKKID